MGDNGKCYDCDFDATVSIKCMGHYEVFKRCPNRYTFSGCNIQESALTCLHKSEAELKAMSIIYDEWTEGQNYINFNQHTCSDHFGSFY